MMHLQNNIDILDVSSSCDFQTALSSAVCHQVPGVVHNMDSTRDMTVIIVSTEQDLQQSHVAVCGCVPLLLLPGCLTMLAAKMPVWLVCYGVGMLLTNFPK